MERGLRQWRGRGRPVSGQVAGLGALDADRAGEEVHNRQIPVSKVSLQKTGVFLDSAGDFWEFWAQKF